MSAVCAFMTRESEQKTRIMRTIIVTWPGLKSRPSSRRCRRRWLQILVEPVQVALQAIALVAWNRQAVELSRIHHELRVDAKTLERLVHLLAAGDGHVEVFLTAHEQRRRLDLVGVVEG